MSWTWTSQHLKLWDQMLLLSLSILGILYNSCIWLRQFIPDRMEWSHQFWKFEILNYVVWIWKFKTKEARNQEQVCETSEERNYFTQWPGHADNSVFPFKEKLHNSGSWGKMEDSLCGRNHVIHSWSGILCLILLI